VNEDMNKRFGCEKVFLERRLVEGVPSAPSVGMTNHASKAPFAATGEQIAKSRRRAQRMPRRSTRLIEKQLLWGFVITRSMNRRGREESRSLRGPLESQVEHDQRGVHVTPKSAGAAIGELRSEARENSGSGNFVFGSAPAAMGEAATWGVDRRSEWRGGASDVLMRRRRYYVESTVFTPAAC